jgi:tRNA threonylcarbamoyl adenosine modification protein YjeE
LEKLNRKHNIDLYIHSTEEMIGLGAELSTRISSPTVITLTGDLGAGKTTLAKGFIAARTGLAPTEITSPTFQYVHFYQPNIVHFDLWRLKGPEEFLNLGLEEHLLNGIVLIEWPDRIHSLIPQDALHIEIAIQEGGRLVTVPRC